MVNSAANTLADVFSNNFDLTVNSGAPITSTTVYAQVYEAQLTLAKTTVAPLPTDAGDPVQYDLTITAAGGANNVSAFDINVIDNLDAALSLTGVAIQTNPGYVTIDDDSSTPGDAGTVDVTLNRLDPGDTVVLRVSGTLNSTAVANQTVPNTATITWTSLPGPNGTGDVTPGNSGDTTGERNGSGGINNYTDTDSVDFTLNTGPSISKGLQSTSLADTYPEGGSDQNDTGIPDVAIGETVTYRITVTMAEGTDQISIVDVLPSVMSVESASVVSIGGNISNTLLSAGDTDTSSGDISISTTTNTNDTVTFNFGTNVVNTADNITDTNDQIVVDVVALVVDDVANANDVNLVNNADVQSSTGTTSSTDDVTVEVVVPDVTLTKSFSPTDQVRGGTVTMTLVVSNLATDGATAPAYDLGVTDVLDDWLDVTNVDVSFNATATTFGSAYTDNSVLTPGYATGVTDNIDIAIDKLPVDGVATITVTMQIDDTVDSASLPRTINNTADVNSDTMPANDTVDRNNSTSDTANLNVVKPALVVAKADSPDPAAPGGPLVYTVTITNQGTPDVDATGVVLTDELPLEFNLTLVTPSQGTCSPLVGQVLTCALGTIASGDDATITLTGTVDPNTADGSTLSNTAYVTSVEGNNGNTGGETPDDNDDERAVEDTLVGRMVDVAITKTVNDTSPNETDLITYTLQVTNNGPSQATDVTVTDNLPAGVTFVRFVPTTLPCTFAAGTLTCTFPTLNAGASQTIGIEATVDVGTSGTTIDNTASVTANETETDNTNNSDTATIGIDTVDLQVTKDVSNSTPNEGDTITYTITVRNNGPAPATGIEITDDLNGVNGVSYVSDDSASTSTTYASGTGVWTLTGITLDAGDSLSLTVTATVDTGASALAQPLTNNATVTAVDQPDSNAANDTDSADIAVGGLDLSLQKGVDNATPNEGDTIVYSILVTNNGAANATNIVVTDQLDTLNVTYVSDTSTSTSTTYNAGTGTWTIPALAVGDNIRLDITVTVDTGTSGSTMTNTATITNIDQTDSNASNNSDTAEITVGGLDLAVQKSVDNATPDEGDTVIYSVTVTNNGPSNATGVEITDALPAGVTYVSDDSSTTSTNYNSGSGVWTVGDLADGDSLTLEISATVDAATSGTTISNTAHAHQRRSKR